MTIFISIHEIVTGTLASFIALGLIHYLEKRPIWTFPTGLGRFLLLLSIFLVLTTVFFVLTEWLLGYQPLQMPLTRQLFLLLFVSFFFVVDRHLLLIQAYKKMSGRVDALELANETAVLEALKNQLDPHFIVNSLNTLSYLTRFEPDLSAAYIDKLIFVYRYILSGKSQDLVTLSREIEFLNNYFHLVRIRHEDSLRLHIRIVNVDTDDYEISRMALQMLLENSIKHNSFSSKKPLVVDVEVHPDAVQIKNQCFAKYTRSEGSGIGLKNLSDRCMILMNKPLSVVATAESFSVSVPIKKISYATPDNN